MISHALSLILQICPHDPTLLSSLLDDTLQHGLAHESRTVLSALLSVAIPRTGSTMNIRPGFVSPLCHPAHSAYLTNLHRKWNGANSTTPFSTRTFVGLLVDALNDSHTLQVWSGKAIRRLARDLRAADFVAFIRLACGLACDLPSSPSTSCRTTETKYLYEREGRKRLAKWMYNIFDRLYGDGTLDRTFTPDQVEDYMAVVEFLLSATSPRARLHTSNVPSAEDDDDDDDENDDVADTIVSLATFSLASPLSAQLSAHTRTALAESLSEATPRHATFDSLILLVFPHRSPAGASPSAEPTSLGSESTLGSPNHILHVLKAHARALRSHSLRRLEAALWAGALRTLDGGWLAPRAVRGRVAAAAALRDELVERVEKAERAAFGGKAGGMRWEEMVGAWVQCTPARPVGLVTPGPVRTVKMTPRVTPKTPRVVESSDEDEDDDSRRGSIEPSEAGADPDGERRSVDPWEVDEDADMEDDDQKAIAETPIPARVLARAANKYYTGRDKAFPIARPQFLRTADSASLGLQPSSKTVIEKLVGRPSSRALKSTADQPPLLNPSARLATATSPTTCNRDSKSPTYVPTNPAQLPKKRLRPILANRQLNGTPHPSKFILPRIRHEADSDLANPLKRPISRPGARYPTTPGIIPSPAHKRARFERVPLIRHFGESISDVEDAAEERRREPQGPSSDDALDLFGCPNSSPVKTRRA